jgi:hypothetical protein
MSELSVELFSSVFVAAVSLSPSGVRGELVITHDMVGI